MKLWTSLLQDLTAKKRDPIATVNPRTHIIFEAREVGAVEVVEAEVEEENHTISRQITGGRRQESTHMSRISIRKSSSSRRWRETKLRKKRRSRRKPVQMEMTSSMEQISIMMTVQIRDQTQKKVESS